MFDFLRPSGMRRPSGAIRRALEADGPPSLANLSELGMVRSGGSYAGRDVTLFRIFDPQRAANRAVDVFTDHTYQDLNAHLDLVLRAGFVERDGAVVIFARPPAVGEWPAPPDADGRADFEVEGR